MRLCTAAVLVGLSLLLMLVFSQLADQLFYGYRVFSKGLLSVQATISSVAPFALWDFLVLGFVLAAIVTLVIRIRSKKQIVPWFSVVALVLSAVFLLFTGGWALNHYAPPLAEQIGLDVRDRSIQDLDETTKYYLEQASRLAESVPRDENGTLVRQDFNELACCAGTAYEPLAASCAIYSGGSDKPVKALLLWGGPLLYSGYVGIFFSPTGEACVAPDCADADLPYAMCHEAAHRLGIASEDEANFSAFLACASSEDARFRYAGYYNAFVYCLNALYANDSDRARAMLAEASESDLRDGLALVRHDMSCTAEHYQEYESGFETVGDVVNDTYLKGFGEEEGIKTYGLVVDYLIALHAKGSSVLPDL